MAHVYKLNEKTASPEKASVELEIPKDEFVVGRVNISKDGKFKSTITDIDPVTGGITWKEDIMPSYEKLFGDLTDVVSVAKSVYVKSKDDVKWREIYEEIRAVRNKTRTHLRNEYPEVYSRMTTKMNEALSVSDMVNLNDKRVDAVANAIMDKYEIPDDGRLRGIIRVALSDYLEEMFSKSILDANEKEVEEMSTSGAAGAYLTPYAFRLNKKALGTDDDTYVKQLGYKLAPNQVKQ